jgi:hypothetical protein
MVLAVEEHLRLVQIQGLVQVMVVQVQHQA